MQITKTLIKMEKKEIIEMMQTALLNSSADVSGDWLNEEEKIQAMSDAALLTQAIALMQGVKNFQF
jgi:putative N-acetylmannosamine-6-phosphate epimerase